MIKKPQILSLFALLAITAVFLVFPSAKGTASVASKKEKAERLWKTSGHADKTGEPFKHWDAEGSIPSSCAKCHSTHGFKDFLNGITDK
ncbi:MAG: hypothetical protein MUP52_12620, partial [Candidatus Aminicenantes bacterium]|nr:hypothetical protein [Candidatus Aminicenantes bacterium]